MLALPRHRGPRLAYISVAAARLAVPGAARLSGTAARLPDPKRVASRTGRRSSWLKRRYETRGMVPETRGRLGRTGEVRRGGWYLHQPPPISKPPNLLQASSGSTATARTSLHLPIVREFQRRVRPFWSSTIRATATAEGAHGGRLYAAPMRRTARSPTPGGIDPRRIYVYGRSLGRRWRRTPPRTIPWRDSSWNRAYHPRNGARITTGYCPASCSPVRSTTSQRQAGPLSLLLFTATRIGCADRDGEAWRPPRGAGRGSPDSRRRAQ